MSEAVIELTTWPLTGRGGLTARVARMAQQLADVVYRAGSPDSGAAESAAFLRGWAGTITQTQYERAAQPLDCLIQRYGLSDVERDLLLLAGLPEEHEGLAATLRGLNPVSEPWCTVGLAALVLESQGIDRVAVRELIRTGPLLRAGLIALVGNGPLFERALQPAEQLWDSLHGHVALPEWLPHIDIGAPPPGLTGWVQTADVERAVLALKSRDTRTVLLQVADQTVALGRCAALTARAAMTPLGARMRASDAAAIRLLAAHAAAHDALPVIFVDPEADPSARSATLAIGDLPGPVLVCAPPGAITAEPHRPILTIAPGPVSLDDRSDAWRVAMPELAADARRLAARHPLDPALTAQLGLDARAGSRLGSSACDEVNLSTLIRARTGLTLPAGIELVTPSVGWERLILPDAAEVQLRDAVKRLDHQVVVLDDWRMNETARATRGIRLLLTGLPGTGKTLAAEAIATAIKTDLCRVDTSQLVSKWIGETEKNLAAAFDAAERTQAVLLLDEADVICGARTKISDAHDRYANLETAYLLQRFDRFDGLVILASNISDNIDAAFLRRMDFIVELPLPDEQSRKRLWEKHFPPERLGADVDLDILARMYKISGGWIRNAAIAAAFLAAADSSRIDMRHIAAAVRREYAKAAIPFPGEPPRRNNDV